LPRGLESALFACADLARAHTHTPSNMHTLVSCIGRVGPRMLRVTKTGRERESERARARERERASERDLATHPEESH
jgi:hypothetical protein